VESATRAAVQLHKIAPAIKLETGKTTFKQ
jgi:hypothetical protein